MEITELLSKHSNQYVLLLDMSWILYRSHYAFPYLSNSEGLKTGSYFGLAKTLQQLITAYPNALILLVDDGNPIDRKELNESYKGNREHTVYFKGKKYTVDCMIQALDNVYRIYHPTLEADDLIFSISRIKEYNNQFIIYSSDKDMYQALDSTTKVSQSISHGELVLLDQYSQKYIDNFKDLEPYQVPFYRACLGDASDNLPIIRPRFPSKVAYYFAKNCVTKESDKLQLEKYYKHPDLTETQNNQLLEIYQSPIFMNNLKLMKLERKEDIPVVDKVKTTTEIQETLQYLQLRQYLEWLTKYVEEKEL